MSTNIKEPAVRIHPEAKSHLDAYLCGFPYGDRPSQKDIVSGLVMELPLNSGRRAQRRNTATNKSKRARTQP